MDILSRKETVEDSSEIDLTPMLDVVFIMLSIEKRLSPLAHRAAIGFIKSALAFRNF